MTTRNGDNIFFPVLSLWFFFLSSSPNWWMCVWMCVRVGIILLLSRFSTLTKTLFDMHRNLNTLHIDCIPFVHPLYSLFTSRYIYKIIYKSGKSVDVMSLWNTFPGHLKRIWPNRRGNQIGNRMRAYTERERERIHIKRTTSHTKREWKRERGTSKMQSDQENAIWRCWRMRHIDLY